LIKCTKCDFENSAEAEFCENCGNYLMPATAKVEDVGVIYCPDCGTKLSSDAEFCANCGYSLGTKCSVCNTVNEYDAKFCKNCAAPQEWICPACRTKNQAGAMFCSECGSNGVSHKIAKWKVLSSVAVMLIVVFLGINIYQFNTAIDKAISYSDDNAFNSANSILTEAQKIWLPFTDRKIQKTKNYINSQEEKCVLLAQQQEEKERTKRQTSNNGRKQQSSSNNSSNNQQSYKKFAAVDFKFSGSVKDARLSVKSLGNNVTEINDGDSCYLKSYGDGINGQYTFTWKFDTNNNPFIDPKYETFSSKFYIDGLHDKYIIYVNVDMFGSVSVDVTGH
jgi:ribosomal protein L40E